MPNYVALKAELQGPAYAGLTDQQAADALNAADPSNPVPKTLTVSGIMASISAPSIAKLYPRPAISTFRDDVVRQDRTAIGNWITLAFIGGDVTESEKNAVIAHLAETQAGPSRAVQTFGQPATHHDVARARSI